MKYIMELLLEDMGIPYEKLTEMPDEVVRFCIPTIYPRYIDIIYMIKSKSYDVDCYEDDDFDSYSVLTATSVSDREALEYVLLFLAQRSSELSERVPYTALPYNDPVNLIADIILEGDTNNEYVDAIANKIVEKRLVFDVKKLVDDVLKERRDHVERRSKN